MKLSHLNLSDLTYVHSDLKNLRKLFPDPSAWMQKSWAKDKNGCIVKEISDGAVCFCLDGGIRRILPWPNANNNGGMIDMFRRRDIIRNVLQEAIKPDVYSDSALDLIDWNDKPGRTFQNVIDVIDKAIGNVAFARGVKALQPA
jgi:hypothetical protein